MTIDGNFETVLLLTGSSMGVILCHLAEVPSGLEEVDALPSSMAGDFLELQPEVTPTTGTIGGATMVDNVEASVKDPFKETEVHTDGEEVTHENTSNILAAGVPSSATSNLLNYICM